MTNTTPVTVPGNTSLSQIAFYNQAFGWAFEPASNHQQWVVTADEHEVDIIIGNPFQPSQQTSFGHLQSVVVKNIDETLHRILLAGGKIVVNKFAVPGIGWMAYYRDLENNVLGIFQADPAVKA